MAVRKQQWITVFNVLRDGSKTNLVIDRDMVSDDFVILLHAGLPERGKGGVTLRKIFIDVCHIFQYMIFI